MYHGWVCIFVFFFFFLLQKRQINDKGGSLCQAWRNERGLLWLFVMKRDGGGWVGQKWTILAWRNYWTAPIYQYLKRLQKKLLLKLFKGIQKVSWTLDKFLKNSERKIPNFEILGLNFRTLSSNTCRWTKISFSLIKKTIKSSFLHNHVSEAAVERYSLT